MEGARRGEAARGEGRGARGEGRGARGEGIPHIVPRQISETSGPRAPRRTRRGRQPPSPLAMARPALPLCALLRKKNVALRIFAEIEPGGPSVAVRAGVQLGVSVVSSLCVHHERK